MSAFVNARVRYYISYIFEDFFLFSLSFPSLRSKRIIETFKSERAEMQPQQRSMFCAKIRFLLFLYGLKSISFREC